MLTQSVAVESFNGTPSNFNLFYVDNSYIDRVGFLPFSPTTTYFLQQLKVLFVFTINNACVQFPTGALNFQSLAWDEKNYLFKKFNNPLRLILRSNMLPHRGLSLEYTLGPEPLKMECGTKSSHLLSHVVSCQFPGSPYCLREIHDHWQPEGSGTVHVLEFGRPGVRRFFYFQFPNFLNWSWHQ